MLKKALDGKLSFNWSPGYGWQKERERRSNEENRQIGLKHRESVIKNFGDPNSNDPNKGPSFKRGHKSFILVGAILYLIYENKDLILPLLDKTDNSTPETKPEENHEHDSLNDNSIRSNYRTIE